jgi:hypothetical protein
METVTLRCLLVDPDCSKHLILKPIIGKYLDTSKEIEYWSDEMAK